MDWMVDLIYSTFYAPHPRIVLELLAVTLVILYFIMCRKFITCKDKRLLISTAANPRHSNLVSYNDGVLDILYLALLFGTFLDQASIERGLFSYPVACALSCSLPTRCTLPTWTTINSSRIYCVSLLDTFYVISTLNTRRFETCWPPNVQLSALGFSITLSRNELSSHSSSTLPNFVARIGAMRPGRSILSHSVGINWMIYCRTIYEMTQALHRAGWEEPWESRRWEEILDWLSIEIRDIVEVDEWIRY